MDPSRAKYINYDLINEKLLASDKIESFKLYPKVNLYGEDNDKAIFIYHLLTTPEGVTTAGADEIYREICNFIDSNYPNYCVLMKYVTTSIYGDYLIDEMREFPGYIEGLYLYKKHWFGPKKHSIIINKIFYSELYKIFSGLRK